MKFFFILLSSVFLFGCASAPKNEIKYIDNFIYVEPPLELMNNCTATKPPPKETYLSSSASEKERLLYEFSNSLLTNMAICNVRFGELRKWHAGQKKIYSSGKP